MKRVLILISLITIILTSCKKENTESNLIPIPKADYMQLEVGNYWIREFFQSDTLGNEIATSIRDTATIVGDTNIAGNIYFKKYSTHGSHFSYIRDSSGYLVNLSGEILFSDHDFGNIIRIDTIAPGVAYINYRMLDNDSLIIVPEGEYQCIEMRGEVNPINPQYPHGVNYTHYFYADGVGQVKTSSFYYSSPDKRVGYKLLSFGNIND